MKYIKLINELNYLPGSNFYFKQIDIKTYIGIHKTAKTHLGEKRTNQIKNIISKIYNWNIIVKDNFFGSEFTILDRGEKIITKKNYRGNLIISECEDDYFFN